MRTETRPTHNVEYDHTAGNVLSVITNVDQSLAANINRGFETPVKSRLRQIQARIEDKSELAQFQRCADHMLALLGSYQPQGKTLAVFTQENGIRFTQNLSVGLETEVRWQALPHIQPLVEAEDEFQEILVVLLDHHHARFVTSRLGEIAEHLEVRNPYPTAHTQSTGHDQQKSQPTFHNKSDERERHYLMAVSEGANAIVAARSIHRIVLAGNAGSCRELYSMFPKPLKSRVVSFAVLPVRATLDQVSEVTKEAQLRAERKYEFEKVERLVDRAGKHDRAVTGTDATMDALTGGRVHELIYAEGVLLWGARCKTCGILVMNHSICPKCQWTPIAFDDAMDMVIGTALDSGATVEQVRGEAAVKLLTAGGIGAFLRY